MHVNGASYLPVCSGESHEHSLVVKESPTHSRGQTAPAENVCTAACVPSTDRQSQTPSCQQPYRRRNSQNVKYIQQPVSRGCPLQIMHGCYYCCYPAIYFHYDFSTAACIHTLCLSQWFNMPIKLLVMHVQCWKISVKTNGVHDRRFIYQTGKRVRQSLYNLRLLLTPKL